VGNAERDRKVVIGILVNGKEEQAQVEEEGAALGEEILIPLEIPEVESGGVGAEEHPPHERQACYRSERDRNVQAPVLSDAFEGESRVPEIVGQQEDGDQRYGVLLDGDGGGIEQEDADGDTPGDGDRTAIEEKGEGRQQE